MFSERELKRLEGFAEILEDGSEICLTQVTARDALDPVEVIAVYDIDFSELLADAIRELIDRYTETEAAEK